MVAVPKCSIQRRNCNSGTATHCNAVVVKYEQLNLYGPFILHYNCVVVSYSVRVISTNLPRILHCGATTKINSFYKTAFAVHCIELLQKVIDISALHCTLQQVMNGP